MTDRTLRLRCLAFATLGLFCALKLPAQQKKIDEQRRIQMQSSVARFMASGSVPGVSVAVVEGGEYVWSKGVRHGRSGKLRTRHETLYRLASTSKSLTPTTAMRLWERGKLDLDTPVQKYCPAIPQKPWPITSRQLLGLRRGNPTLQVGLAGRSRGWEYQAFRRSHRGRPEFFCQ